MFTDHGVLESPSTPGRCVPHAAQRRACLEDAVTPDVPFCAAPKPPDGRRSAALFGVRAVVVYGAHSIACQAQFRMLCLLWLDHRGRLSPGSHYASAAADSKEPRNAEFDELEVGANPEPKPVSAEQHPEEVGHYKREHQRQRPDHDGAGPPERERWPLHPANDGQSADTQ